MNIDDLRINVDAGRKYCYCCGVEVPDVFKESESRFDGIDAAMTTVRYYCHRCYPDGEHQRKVRLLQSIKAYLGV